MDAIKKVFFSIAKYYSKSVAKTGKYTESRALDGDSKSRIFISQN